MMKTLLSITAVFECVTGIALIAIPSTIVPILLGIPFEDDSLHLISGITGAALMTIAIACWLFRNSGLQATSIVKSIFFYNSIVGLILLYGALGLGLSGIGLWPAMIVHVGLAAWCILALSKK